MEQKGKMVPSSSVPPEILWSSLPLILKQFPVKTLLKLRCVSKVWCSIIDDPDFIRLHHNHSHTRPDGVSIVLMNKDGGDYQLYSVDPEGGPLVDLLEVPSLFVSKYYSSVYEPNYADTIQLQSVNGLVCIQNRIWNPSTRQRIEIPPRKESTTTFLDVPTYLLGFDPFSDKYKILNKQVVVSIDGGGVEKRVEYQILTIGTNEWREIDSVPNEFVPYHRNHRSCCIEGVIYSFACISDEDMILAFELTREEFRIIPLPPEVDHVDCCDFYLIEVRERLGLINGAMTTISILEDSEKIVWMTQNSIFPDFILKYYEGSKFTPIGAIHTEILLCVDDWNTQVKRFFYYDLESKRLRRVDAVPNLLDIFQYGIYYTKHVESLFRLKSSVFGELKKYQKDFSSRCGECQREKKERQQKGTLKIAKTMEQKGKMVASSSVPREILWSSLPKGVMCEILKQFPVKTLLKLRCVSKVWCSIIDDPDFIRLHHNHSHTRPDGVSILLMIKCNDMNYGSDSGDYYKLYSQDPEGGPIVHLLKVPSVFVRSYGNYYDFQPDHEDTLQSVNGLVCIQNRIWNPSTRQRIHIPTRKTQVEGEDYPCREFRFYSRYFLGFDPFSDQYKILHRHLIISAHSAHGGGVEERVEYQILTIGTNVWREIDYVPHVQMVPNQRSCCIAGVIYSFARISDGSVVILAFELRHEEFRIIPLPQQEYYADYTILDLVQLGERLGLIIMNGDYGEVTRISTLEDYEKTVWKTENIMLPDYLKYSIPISGSIHTGEILLGHESPFYYNLESRRFRRVDGFSNLPCNYDFCFYTKHVESLFQLKKV